EDTVPEDSLSVTTDEDKVLEAALDDGVSSVTGEENDIELADSLSVSTNEDGVSLIPGEEDDKVLMKLESELRSSSDGAVELKIASEVSHEVVFPGVVVHEVVFPGVV
ncbi:hypothetical protein OXX69_013250, partial [Metschnikowia pulcherrima]